MSFRKKIIVVFVAVLLCTGGGFLVAYGGDKAEASANAEEMPQAMPVSVAMVTPEQAQLWKNFSGRVVPVDRAEIRPQVDGRIDEIRFTDGQYVKKGEVLFVIDPKPYRATLNQAKATLAAAKTQVGLAEKEYERAQKLIESDAIAQSVLDERLNNYNAAAAAVEGAKALVASAEINLDYAYIKAPISGKVSRAEITVGNLVQSGSSAPLLTSIVADEKVYIDFEVDEKTYIHSVRKRTTSDNGKIPVRVPLGEGLDDYEGYIQSFDNRIDPASGTIRARAILENKNKILLSGMTVTVLMGEPSDDQKILLTEKAIGTDQDRKFVYTVNGENMTEYREVKVGESIEGRRIILSGLQSGDQVITDGIVKLRPGMPVVDKTTLNTETK